MAQDWRSNILIATVGTAPSVVTETVWALLGRKDRWVPTEIYLLTTVAGEAACERHLRQTDGQLASLFEDQQLPFVRPELVVPRLPDGSKIGDIRTVAENIAFADDITKLIKSYTERLDSRVHVSIAGGRRP